MKINRRKLLYVLAVLLLLIIGYWGGYIRELLQYQRGTVEELIFSKATGPYPAVYLSRRTDDTSKRLEGAEAEALYRYLANLQIHSQFPQNTLDLDEQYAIRYATRYGSMTFVVVDARTLAVHMPDKPPYAYITDEPMDLNVFDQMIQENLE